MDILSGSVANLLDKLNFGIFGAEGTIKSTFFGIASYVDIVEADSGQKMDIATTVWPKEPTDCILVRSTGGGSPPNDTTSRPTISISVRSKYMDVCERKIRIIHEVIKKLENFYLNDNLYCYNVSAMNEPGFVNQDSDGNYIFSSNYILRVKFK